MSNFALLWVLFGACLVLSFVLSGMESGVFALSRLRIRQQMRAGRPSARVLHKYLEHPENFLWTIVVGNTLANLFILGWVVVLLHQSLLHQRLLFVAVFSIIVFLFYALFDLLPKILFRTFPNRLCLALAQPFRLVHFGLRPLVRLVEWLSEALLRLTGGKVFTGHLFGNREELRLLMQESGQAFTAEERVMISRVLDLESNTVRQAMRPMSETVVIDAQQPLSAALEICREKSLSRLPVYETRDSQKRIVGLLNLNAILFRSDYSPTKPVSNYLQPAIFMNEDTRLEVSLRRLQRSGQRLAIVLGRNGRETGVLALQDVLNLIFGRVSL